MQVPTLLLRQKDENLSQCSQALLSSNPSFQVILLRCGFARNHCRRQDRDRTRSPFTLFEEPLACVHDCITWFVKMQLLWVFVTIQGTHLKSLLMCLSHTVRMLITSLHRTGREQAVV